MGEEARHRDAVMGGTAKWVTLAIFVVSYAIYSIDKNILSVLIISIKSEFQLSDSIVGLLFGFAVIVPFVITCIPLGMLGDRLPRKWVMATLIAGWSLMTGLSGLATGITFLFVARMAVGALEGGFNPNALSLLSDTFPKHQRSSAMGIFTMGPAIGMCVSMAAGGVIAHHYGWRAGYFIAGVPGLVMAVLIALFVKEPTRGRYDDEPVTTNAYTATQLLTLIRTNRPLLLTTIGMAFCTTVPSALGSWTPSYLVRMYGFDIRQAGISAALVVGICGALGAAVHGVIADRMAKHGDWRRLSVVLISIPLNIASGVSAFTLAGTSTGFLIFLALTIFFAQSFIGIGNSIIATLTPSAGRAAVLAILTIVFNLSYAVGTSTVGFLSDALAARAGTNSIGWALCSMLLLSAIGTAFFRLAQISFVKNEQDSGRVRALSAGEGIQAVPTRT